MMQGCISLSLSPPGQSPTTSIHTYRRKLLSESIGDLLAYCILGKIRIGTPLLTSSCRSAGPLSHTRCRTCHKPSLKVGSCRIRCPPLAGCPFHSDHRSLLEAS